MNWAYSQVLLGNVLADHVSGCKATNAEEPETYDMAPGCVRRIPADCYFRRFLRFGSARLPVAQGRLRRERCGQSC
jgi:hypothetical protein